MPCEFISGLEVTYGNALAAGGGFHRVTTAEGTAAEVSPHTYLWYKLSSPRPPMAATSDSDSDSHLAIMQLRMGTEQEGDNWIKLDKSIDRTNGRYLWFQVTQFKAPTSPSTRTKQQLMPLKEIRVVRHLKDLPEGFEALNEPLVNAEDGRDELRTYLCFRRLASEDFSDSKWSILNQKVGEWIDVKDLSSNKWSVAQIVHQTASEIRVHIPTWRKGRDEFLPRLTCTNRVDKLGKHTNVYMSPAYPLPRKQGILWNANMKDLHHAREQFDKYFYDRDKQQSYLPRLLIPFIEKSLLSTLLSSDLADEMNAFYQHILKNVVACTLGNDAGSVMVYMLSILRMILNGHSSCMFFYSKYPGSYTAAKYQRLVYMSYLVGSDALTALPACHPCRSLHFVDNVDLFVQAGGFRLILDRLEGAEVALTEVLLYCTILKWAKPCLTQQKCRSPVRRRSTIEAQTGDFVRDFLNATFSRLRRMSSEELKDDSGLIDQIVGVLDLLCRDGLLLGDCSGAGTDETVAASRSALSCDVEFTEAIETFHLDLSKKLICCPYLSQRLLGISRTNDLILMAQQKDTLQKKSSSASVRTPSSISPATSVSTTTLSVTPSLQALTFGDQPMTKWLRTTYIAEWLVASDILEVILGDRQSCAKYSLQDGAHLEILKRSEKIFGFVAAHGLLTEQHIVLMWKTALSQLRSGRKTVFDILISLCSVLSADLIDVIMMLLTQVPSSDYDELIVNFIKRVIMIASKLIVDMETGSLKMTLTSLVSAASGSKQLSVCAQKDVEVLIKVVSLCCMLYWNALLQTEVPNDEGMTTGFGLRGSMRSEVEAALADSLNHVQKLWISAGASSFASGREQQQLLSDYLRKCAENIKSGTLVETCMNLIYRIVDGYGGSTSSLAASTLALTRTNTSPTTPGELLEGLDSMHNIVSVVVEVIKDYAAASRPIDAAQAKARVVALKKRLAFLGFIVTRSDLKLPYDAVCQLWTCFDCPSNTAEERDVFFAWLTTVIPDPNNFVHRAYSGHTGFSGAVVCEIFQSLIEPQSASTVGNDTQIRLDLRTMNRESFWVLERLFRFVNTSARRMVSLGVAKSAPSRSVSNDKMEAGLFVVEALDLQGLETLYDVALFAENDVVSQQATNYLIYLQLHVGSKLVRREVWTDFVTNCLSRLKETVKSTTVHESKTREIFRLLVLLDTFLYQSVVQPQENGGLSGPEGITVYIRTQGGRVAAPFQYYVRRTSLVSELRDRIANDTGHPADRVRIVNSAKTKLTAQGHGKFTLEKARVFGPSSVSSRLSPRRSQTQTATGTPRRTSKYTSYVEAILLSKVESDTSGHTSRSIMDYHGAVGVAAAGNISSSESDWHVIRLEISGNDTWVALMFNLLSYNNGIAEEAWKVLRLLTPNEDMEKQMRLLTGMLAIDGSIRGESGSFSWDTVLDLTCPGKLLYQLELVEKFALCGDGRQTDENKNADGKDCIHIDDYDVSRVDGGIGAINTWSASFLELGGLAQLEKFVLLSSPCQLLAQGTLSVMCLSKLLLLLRHFVLVESKLAKDGGLTLKTNLQQLNRHLFGMLISLQSIHEEPKEADPVTTLSHTSASSQLQHSTAEDDRLDVTQPLLTVYDRPQVEDRDNINNIPNDAHLMTRLLSCIATCSLMTTQGALALLTSCPGHGDIILRCLVESRFQPVRQEAANAITVLSTTTNENKEDRAACCNYFLRLLCGYAGAVHDEEYYNVLTLLITNAENLTEFAILESCRTLCRRIKTFRINDDVRAGPPSSTFLSARRSSLRMEEKECRTSAGPTSSTLVPSPSPDVLLEGQLSTMLAIMKRIPVVLAGDVLDAPCDGRSLRGVIAQTLHAEEGIINELFHECLFSSSDKQTKVETEIGRVDKEDAGIQASSTSHYFLEQPKCRSDTCREVAFDLLRELSIDNTDGLRFLLTQIANQHTLERPSGARTKTSTASMPKKKSSKVSKDRSLQRKKFVGLKNLGCTCYLNSTIQSFFMMPRFRHHILRLQSSSTKSDKASLTYELQSLFAHLEGSAKPYYNPLPLICAMKTWDGESVDVNVQQDASEFLTSFFQQIESEMNGVSAGTGGQYTGDENILNTFFGGEFSNELIAEGDRYSERCEPFHFISVPVRDRKNLKESLDGWVEGDKVSYTWETGSDSKIDGKLEGYGGHDAKVTLETHKRISISKLPSYLIIHLKRFEFDFEKMQQTKLHDRFEFPTELDLYPYTKEGQQEKRKALASSGDDGATGHKIRLSTCSDSMNDRRTTAPEYSQYELVGTVVHLGTALSGHYYSFLRDQQVPRDKSQWYEFNDTVVTPFDPLQIPDECFGGEESTRDTMNSKFTSPEETSTLPAKMKNRSSFMLFYARVPPDLRAISKNNVACISFSNAVFVTVFCVRLKKRASVKLAYLRSVACVIAPEPIRKLIATENRLFWRKRYLYDTKCLKFTYDLLRSCLVGLDSSATAAVVPCFEPAEAQFEALQVATRFVFGTLWQGGDVTKVLEWRPILQALYHTDIAGCRWFLSTMEANESLLLELLVFNEHCEVRELMANVVSEAIATTSNMEFEEEVDEELRAARISGKKQLPASFEFMFFLIQLMPALLTVPNPNHRQYFLVMYDFVQTGRNEGSFLVVNSVVGAIVALLTGMGSSQPLLQRQLKKYKSSQILKRIDFNVTILKLLSVLIRCSLPPAMDVEVDDEHPLVLPSSMAHDHVGLSPADHSVLLNERFITLLTQRANHYTKETKPLEQIVTHLCWESRRITAEFVKTIMHGIEVEDHHDVKPYFRTLNSLLKIRDSLAVKRLTDSLTELVAVMTLQQRYFKATETSLDMLTRLAKRHSGVTQWLRENRQSCEWMEQWLDAHRGADGWLQQHSSVLVKPNSTSSWVNVSVTSAGLIKTIDRSTAKLLPRIRSILNPEAVVDTFYDSDDNPHRLVGKRVRVKWAKDRWYEGNVQQFNEDTYEHFVVYDDGDKRLYRMSEKLFYVVNLAPSPKPHK
uniref:USP domain-containing protein n=1 Tax=Peronospora matthiolae TaxID=2874970 RepID=A0AAV1TV08_9STRA